MKMKERVRAPGPTPVPEKSRLTLAEENAYHRTPETSRLIQNCVEKLQAVMAIDWPVVPLAASGTGAMQMAVKNTTRPDDTALVIEGGKFGERWTRLLQKQGTEVVRYPVEWGESADPGALRERLEERPEVATVFGTFVETSTLVRHPIEEMGEAVGDRALFVVDAISGLGAEPFWPGDWNVDLVVGGSQKGLMTPPGLALVAASDPAVDRARRVGSDDLYFDLPEAIDTLHEDFQTAWTPSLNLIRSLHESLSLLLDEGLESVFERHRTLGSVCRRAVQAIGLEVLPSTPSNIGTAASVPGGFDADAVRRTIHEKYGTFFPGGQKHYEGRLIRIGHLGHVDYFDLLSALGALELGLREAGFDVDPGQAVTVAQETFDGS